MIELVLPILCYIKKQEIIVRMKKIKQFFEHKYSWGARGVSWPLRLTCFALSFMAIRMDWQSFRDERGVSWPLECIAFLSSTFTKTQITVAKIRTGNTWPRKNLAGIDLDKHILYEISFVGRCFLATRMNSFPFQHIYRAANHCRCNSNWKHMVQKESGRN